MGINSMLYDCDESKVKILAGDLSEGIWELSGSTLRRMTANTTESTLLDLKGTLESVEMKNMLNKDSFEPLLGAGVGLMLGMRFGPIGAIGGAVLGHYLVQNRPRMSVMCKLRDGRHFIAVVSPKVYQELQHLASQARSEASSPR